jgi:mono/diheme cytochrome c family protein
MVRHPEPEARPVAPMASPMAQARRERHKIPFWAMPVLAALPLWAYVYTGTLSPPPAGEGPAVVGEDLYASSGCAGCHGASGAGSGSFPAFTGGGIYETWPSFVEHFEWVRLGSAGWLTERGETYGANDKPVNGGMPGFGEDQLSDADLLYIVLHERLLGGDNPDTEDAEAIEAVALLMSENADMTFEEAVAEVGVEPPDTDGGGSGPERGDPPPENAPSQDGTPGSEGNDGPGTSGETGETGETDDPNRTGTGGDDADPPQSAGSDSAPP